MSNVTEQPLKKTPLHALHVLLGAKMVPFAGYDMPVQFPMGVLKEHLHTREKAGLFDVSHMGQAVIVAADHTTAASALETLVPGEIQKLGIWRQRLTVLLSEEGGILDDLMVSRPDTDGRVNIVVNGACKDADYAYLDAKLPKTAKLERFDNRALLALQGPMASQVLAQHCAAAADLKFMSFAELQIGDITAVVTRGGYTGEDGFEISVWEQDAEKIAKLLLDDPRVEPIGLGARDSLRLEAGMCLYGHDLNPEISPVEANLNFTIGKRRREEGGFAGEERIQRELRDGPQRLRVGIQPSGRAPAREGAEIQSADGKVIGVVTSGGFGPSAGTPVAMGYVEADFAADGTELNLMVRGKPLPAVVAPMPFVPHNYFRGKGADHERKIH